MLFNSITLTFAYQITCGWVDLVYQVAGMLGVCHDRVMKAALAIVDT